MPTRVRANLRRNKVAVPENGAIGQSMQSVASPKSPSRGAAEKQFAHEYPATKVAVIARRLKCWPTPKADRTTAPSNGLDLSQPYFRRTVWGCRTRTPMNWCVRPGQAISSTNGWGRIIGPTVSARTAAARFAEHRLHRGPGGRLQIRGRCENHILYRADTACATGRAREGATGPIMLSGDETTPLSICRHLRFRRRYRPEVDEITSAFVRYGGGLRA